METEAGNACGNWTGMCRRATELTSDGCPREDVAPEGRAGINEGKSGQVRLS